MTARDTQIVRRRLAQALLDDAAALEQLRVRFEPRGVHYEAGESVLDYAARGHRLSRDAFVRFARVVISGGSLADGMTAALQFRPSRPDGTGPFCPVDSIQ